MGSKRVFTTIVTMEKKVQIFAQCKINLVLNILGKRGDGFHEIETLMGPVGLFDEVEVQESDSMSLTCNQPGIPLDSKNLAWRAAECFFDHANIKKAVRIHLEKRVPSEAGLGGGSSNAAATLVGLNQLFQTGLKEFELEKLGALLGSDVPFFIRGRLAMGFGRGEILEPVEVSGEIDGFHVVLVKPEFGVSTPWAYKALADYPGALHGRSGRVKEAVEQLRSRGGVEVVSSLLYNSLEMPVFGKYPFLRLISETLLREGAKGALMSGSGSTVFGLASSAAGAKEIAERIGPVIGPRSWVATARLNLRGVCED